ncbi:amidohydrolase [Cellulomonas sp. NPDC089187]|uniref:amidohydrolase n=1 Tax=Cellulomonas sp. NPDC089187 TaxID=3154970 RepID=UPI00341355F5
MTAVTEVLAPLADTRQWQEELYVHLHQHPELSSHETETAAEIQRRLTSFGYDVTPVGGGVVGVLKNGEGPTVLMRADIDGLPVTEQTGLPYASTATTVDDDGNTVGLMHACGHDVHITTLLGAAELMAKTRAPWSGTFIALFQPAEETAAGAQAMLDAGLTDVIPRPDVAFGQHVLGHEAGRIGITPGPVMSCADSIKITLYGAGSHGSMPQLGVDPIVLASAVVQRLQGIVARELTPGERAVVTVGALNAGTKSNIIPDRATLLVNTRVYSDEVRAKVLGAIERIVKAECEASDSPKPPTFEYYDQFPLTSNDQATSEKVRAAFDAHFGTDRVFTMEAIAASEDFSRVPDAFGTPYTYWGLGGFPAGAKAAPNHSPFFAPVQQPTLTAGTEAVVVAALAYLSKDA